MSEYVSNYDVWITQQKMPIRVRAFCAQMEDEDCVVVNQDLSEEKKMDAVAHEILHFRRNDLNSDLSVSEIERNLR